MKQSTFIKLMAGILTLFLIVYLWPLTRYHQNLAGGEGDAWAHAGMTQWFCNNFFHYDFQAEEFMAPYGANMASGYDAPLPFSVSCLLKFAGPVAMFNFYAAAQISLVIITSFFLAKRSLTQLSLQLAFVLLNTFSGFMFARMTNHYNLVATIWGANLAILSFDQLDFSKRRQVLLAFLGLTAAFLSSWQNIPNLFVLILVLVFKQLISLKRKGMSIHISLKTSLDRLISNSVLSLIASLVIFLPFALPMITNTFHENLPGSTLELGFAPIYGLIIPWKTHPFFPLTPEFMKNQTTFESIIGIDWLIIVIFLVLTCFHVIKRRRMVTVWPYLVVGIYLAVSLGTEVKLFGHRLNLGYWEDLYRFIPFSLTRYPSRIAVVLIPIITLTSFRLLEDFLKNQARENMSKIVGSVLCLYAVVVTILLSGNWRAPHARYDALLPTKSLEQIKHDNRTENVLNIPLAIASDQKQTFLQAFHQKPLMGGYVSYRSLTVEHQEFLNNQPVLYNLDCMDRGYDLASDEFTVISNPNSYNQYFIEMLKRLRVGYLIVNHDYLHTHDICHRVKKFVDEQLPTYAGLELLEHNGHMSIYALRKIDALTQPPSFFVTPAETEWIRVDQSSSFWLRQQQMLYLFSPQASVLRYAFDLNPYPEATQTPTLDVEVNFEMLKSIAITQPGVYQGSFPIKAGLNTMKLWVNDCYRRQQADQTLCVGGIINALALSEAKTP